MSRSDGLRDLGVPLGLYAAGAAFVIWHARLLGSPPVDVLWWWSLLAVAPAVIARIGHPRAVVRRYVAAAFASVIAAIGFATGYWPFHPHLLGRHGYFALVGRSVRRGGHQWLRNVLPFHASRTPELRSLVILVVFVCLAVLAAALIVRRSPTVATIITFIPLLVVSTVFSLRWAEPRAVMMLALALGYASLTAPPAPRRIRLAAGLVVVVVGASLAALPGVAKSAFVNWRTIGLPGPPGVTVGYIWKQTTYGALHRPAQPVPLLDVTIAQPTYLRAVVLDRFNGIGWDTDQTVVARASAPTVAMPGQLLSTFARNISQSIGSNQSAAQQAQIRNINLASDGWLVGPGEALVVNSIPQAGGTISITDAQTLRTASPLPITSVLTFAYAHVNPEPAALIPIKPLYPPAVISRELALLPQNVIFPPFATPGREAIVNRLFDQYFTTAKLRRWREAYQEARRVVGRLGSPYDAAIALEEYFQSSRFSYSESASYAGAADGPLPSFFLGRGAGYCQMFSGTMTVLLRMLGIPARIAEGFTPGTLQSDGTYLVTDREAHAWVEVYFPTYGWLPFEPTQHRSLSFDYSSSSPSFALAAAQAINILPDSAQRKSFGLLAHGPRLLGRPGGPQRGGGSGLREQGQIPHATNPPATNGSLGFTVIVAGIIICCLGLLYASKRLRTVGAYLSRDPHRIASAGRRELEAYVIDQGAEPTINSLTATEFDRLLRRSFGVDATEWARAQVRARYGRPGPDAVAAAREARSQARRLRRRLARSLSTAERARGVVRLRSLTH